MDSTTNALSLFEIIEEMQLAIPPGEPPIPEGAIIPRELCLVTLLTRNDENVPEPPDDLTLVLHTPGVKKLSVGSTMHVDLTTHKRFRLIARAPGLAFFGFGTYVFSLRDSHGTEQVRYGVPLTEGAVVPSEIAASPLPSVPAIPLVEHASERKRQRRR